MPSLCSSDTSHRILPTVSPRKKRSLSTCLMSFLSVLLFQSHVNQFCYISYCMFVFVCQEGPSPFRAGTSPSCCLDVILFSYVFLLKYNVSSTLALSFRECPTGQEKESQQRPETVEILSLSTSKRKSAISAQCERQIRLWKTISLYSLKLRKLSRFALYRCDRTGDTIKERKLTKLMFRNKMEQVLSGRY